MHGQGIERGWVLVARRVSGHAVLCQRGAGVARDGVVSDGGCGQGGVVLWVYGTA